MSINKLKNSSNNYRYVDNKVHENVADQHKNNDIIGKTIITEKFSSTMDTFWVLIKKDMIIDPFDFVTVENICDTKTIGMINELQTLNTEYLYSEIKDNLKLDTLDTKRVNNNEEFKEIIDSNYKDITVAKIFILANTGIRKSNNNSDKRSILIPIGINKSVRFSSSGEILFAIGIPKMENPIPAGIIEMSNGTLLK